MGGATYQGLLSQGSQSCQRPRGIGGGVRARARALLRWAVVRLSCAARRRYRCGRQRRLAWPGLCARGASAAVAAPERKIVCAGRRSAAACAGAGAVVVGYDSASYARNFDDGSWKAEEGVSWAGGGFFPRASIGGANVNAAGGGSVPSSILH